MSFEITSEVYFLGFVPQSSSRLSLGECIWLRNDVCLPLPLLSLHKTWCVSAFRLAGFSKEQQVVKSWILLMALESHFSYAPQVLPVIEANRCPEFCLSLSSPILWVILLHSWKSYWIEKSCWMEEARIDRRLGQELLQVPVDEMN